MGGKPDHSVRRPWLRGVLRCGLLLAAASLAVFPAAQTAFAAPAPVGASGSSSSIQPDVSPATLTQAEQTLKPILDKLHSLYQQTEVETQKYDQLTEQLKKAQTNVASLNLEVQNAQEAVDAGLTLAGQIASNQYRAGSDPSGLSELLFGDSPEEALYADELLRMAAQSQAQFVARLQQDKSQLEQTQNAALVAQQQAQQLVTAEGVQKASINKQLAAVEKTVSTLTGAQKDELAQLEQKEASEAQTALLASGLLGDSQLKPSAAGAAAVAYAFAQLGKPYVWGGAGPNVFDCSGLTSQAWLHAGVPIPRTSEEQWAQLTKVPLDALRPGDLIIYFSGASHVAIYIGGGEVIQAPHPGAYVDVAPIAQNPILGAVRPDPDSPSVGSYKAPAIPKSATAPQPIAPVAPKLPKPTSSPSSSSSPAPKPSGKPSGKPSSSPSAGGGKPSGSPSPSAPASTPASPSPSASGSDSEAPVSGSASASTQATDAS